MTHDEDCKCVGGVTSQHEMPCTGKQIVMVGRHDVLSQSLPGFRYRLSIVRHISLNVLEQNYNGQRFEFNLLENSCALFIVQPSL